jgi:hypothetical protein
VTTSAGPTFKDAFVTAAETLWAGTDVQVAFGHPGMHMADDLVVFGAVSSEQNPATFGQRSREEILTLEVVVSVYRGGDSEMEKVTSDRAYALLAQLEQYARVTDTTIGGSVRHCFLASYSSTGVTDPNVLAAGRETDITAQFVAAVRIT